MRIRNFFIDPYSVEHRWWRLHFTSGETVFCYICDFVKDAEGHPIVLIDQHGNAYNWKTIWKVSEQ